MRTTTLAGAGPARPPGPGRRPEPGRLPDAGRLDPVGRAWLPRRSTLLRLVTVAVLLLTAAGVVYAGDTRPGQAPTPEPDQSTTAAPAHPGQAGVAGTAPPAAPPAGVWSESSGPARLPIPTGLVGVPVRLADPTGLAVLRPGDRVDLLAVPAGGGEPAVVAPRAPVLAVDRAATALLLALRPDQAEMVVATADEHAFAIIVR